VHHCMSDRRLRLAPPGLRFWPRARPTHSRPGAESRAPPRSLQQRLSYEQRLSDEHQNVRPSQHSGYRTASAVFPGSAQSDRPIS